MSIIYFTPLNSKTKILIFFIFITCFCYIAPKLYGGIDLYNYTLIDNFCQILLIIPYFIEHKFDKKSILPDNLTISKRDIIILILIIIINFCNTIIYITYDETLSFLVNLFIMYNAETIFLMILSIYCFKYKYYAHHLIGIILFIISVSIIDLYKIKFNHKELIYDWQHISISILNIIFESVLVTYKKYLVEVKYFSFCIVSFLFGVISILSIIILLILKLFNTNVMCFYDNCITIFDFIDLYFQKNIKFLGFIFSIVCISTFYFFYYYTFSLFTTSHVLLSFYISIIISIFMKDAKIIKTTLNWIALSILILFSMFGLFIFLEIIEIGIFNLNKYTRRTISQRSEQQVKEDLKLLEDVTAEEDEDDENKNVEFSPGYLIKFD